ncbi:hypothetical protein [Pyxidicoccus trucidator]|uniref:hypothetical protein n=1 Tax=Pyxidicoccus trucidator TaxID=2709662 RepID=UPI0013DA83CD|nr:hypothetical protein [Pyxidicoccus trucidator]
MPANRTFDFFALDQQLLRLESPRFQEALIEVRGTKDAGAAWDRLLGRGLLPASWAEPGRCVFRVPRIPTRGRNSEYREQPRPRSTEAVAWVAASAEVMLAVEALAWEVAEALVPWGQSLPRRLVWHVLPRRKLKQFELRREGTLCHAMAMLDAHTGKAAPRTPGAPASTVARLSRLRARDAARRVFTQDVSIYEHWARAVAAGALVPRGPYHAQYRRVGMEYVRFPFSLPEALVGRPYAELPDPCSPLMAIWDAGCMLGWMSDDALVLHLPPPPLDASAAREAQVARIPKYRVGTARAVPRDAALEFLRPFLAGPVDPGASVFHCDDGSVVHFRASDTEGLVFVELQCQFHVRERGVSTGHLTDFARFCERSGSQVKRRRNGHLIPASGAALFSDARSSPAFRMAMHLAGHPRDVRIPE